MENNHIKTIIISDINIEGHIVEIFINDTEIAYLEQKDFFSPAKITFLDGSVHFSDAIIDKAIEQAKKHLFEEERTGLEDFSFHENKTPEEYNADGDRLVKRILYDPCKQITRKYYHFLKEDVTDVFENNGKGCGVRFKKNADLIGFLDKKEKEMTNLNNPLDLNARYDYSPPCLDFMIIGPSGETGSIGDDDEEGYPMTWFFKKSEDTVPSFVEVIDWSERTKEVQDGCIAHISKVMGWDLSLLKELVKHAEENPHPPKK